METLEFDSTAFLLREGGMARPRSKTTQFYSTQTIREVNVKRRITGFASVPYSRNESKRFQFLLLHTGDVTVLFRDISAAPPTEFQVGVGHGAPRLNTFVPFALRARRQLMI
jgi:hypothetical protein